MNSKRPAPVEFDQVEACVDWILERTGRVIKLALPLGLGKANLIANALYGRALADPGLELCITTALSLEVPTPGSDLERRLLQPVIDRLFAGYPQLQYAADRRANRLPKNISVVEFFMSPGALLNNAHAQLNYVSSNYTHITRDLIDRGVNVIGQLVTHKALGNQRKFSLSCNPDLTLDITTHQRRAGNPLLMIGEVNGNLPFMYGDAVVEPDFFDALVENPDTGYTLFGMPKAPIDTTDYMIGLHASTLVRDGGTLQVGIGSLGDAVVYALGLRQSNNSLYRKVLDRCGIPDRFDAVISRLGGLGPFDEGLYGATEMLVDGFLHLYHAGILKRRVYRDVPLQSLINEKRIDPVNITTRVLLELADVGAVNPVLSDADVGYLKYWGIFEQRVELIDGLVVLTDGSRFAPDLSDQAFLDSLAGAGLGRRLKNGVIAHGGFFLGPQRFYQDLNRLSEEERQLINMTSVLAVNQLYGNELLDSLQRKDARFINSCLFATLTGAIVSDGLEDQRVLSGVGGQFDFVSMAHALKDGRSIIKVRSTRNSKGSVSSNIRLGYAHTTIPRHLRDIVISEYGIAELRGKTDSEVASAMLNIADSRYQPRLLDEARRAGKVPKNYRIPDRYRNNFAAKLEDQLREARRDGTFPDYPFGTDLSETEQTLARALKQLASATATPTRQLLTAIRAWRDADPAGLDDYLARMDLSSPNGLRQKIMAKMLINELNNII